MRLLWQISVPSDWGRKERYFNRSVLPHTLSIYVRKKTNPTLDSTICFTSLILYAWGHHHGLYLGTLTSTLHERFTLPTAGFFNTLVVCPSSYFLHACLFLHLFQARIMALTSWGCFQFCKVSNTALN